MERRPVLTALCCLGLTTSSEAAADDAYELRVLKDQDGQETSLAAQAAQRSLVVVVMKGYWCRVCVAQLQRMGELKARLDALGATYVGLNADAPADNLEMKKKEEIDCQILSDEQHQVLDKLGLWLPRAQRPLPAIVVFDRCGDEAARWVGRRPGARPESALLRLLRKLAQEKRICSGPNA
jgi:peroxiredoxin